VSSREEPDFGLILAQRRLPTFRFRDDLVIETQIASLGTSAYTGRRRKEIVMKSQKLGALAILSVIALLASSAPARAAGGKLAWKRIVGIADAGSIVGRRASGEDCNVGVDCVAGTLAPWTATDGHAEVDLDKGRIAFSVRGLVIASDPSFANLGTTTVVTMVKGTLVCNDTEPGVPDLVDTDAVALDARGNADFHGHVDLPASCAAEPNDIVFLIRIADVSDEDHGFLIDLWNAFGAVRTGGGTSLDSGEGE
jgi:hypothetical protein